MYMCIAEHMHVYAVHNILIAYIIFVVLTSKKIRTDSIIREIQALTPFNQSPYIDLYMA